MKKKKYIAMLWLFVTILMGCSGIEDQSDMLWDESSLKSEENTLKISVWDYETSIYYQEIIKHYQEETGNKVELVNITSNDYIDKLSDMLYSSQDLDVILAKDIPSFVEMIKRGQLEELGPYIEENQTDLRGYHGLTDQILYEGKLYGLPFRNDYYLLFYNKDLFDAAQIPYPTNDMTWEEYRQLAGRLTSGEGENKIYGSHLHTWRMLVQNIAIQDGLHTLVTDDYSFMKPAYEMALQMQEEGSIMDFVKLKSGNIHYRGMFHSGKIAMLPMGSWLINDTISAIRIGDIKIKRWGIATLPHEEGEKPGKTMGASTQAAINVRSEKKELAYDFIRFLCGAEGAKILAQNGAISAWSDDEVKRIYASAEGFPKDCMDALNTTQVVFETPVDKHVAEINKILTKEHELIMTGNESIDEGLEHMGELVSKEMLDN